MSCKKTSESPLSSSADKFFSGQSVWSGIDVKIKVAFHCADLALYAVLFEFNVATVAFSCRVAN